MYLVVEFTDDRELAVIPNTWLDGTSCALWPLYKSSGRIMNAVIHKEVPGENWKSFPVRELYRNGDYEKARKKLRLAEVQSDLQTMSEEESDEASNRRSRRKKRSPSRFSSSSDEDSERELTPMCKKKQKTVTESPASIHNLPPLPHPPPRIQVTKPNRSLSPIVGTSSTSNSNSITMPSIPTTPRSTCVPVPALSPTPVPITPSRTANQDILHSRDIRLFTLLEKIREDQIEIKTMVTNILQKQNVETGETGTLPDDVQFPLNTLEELEELEAKLMDKTIFHCLVNHFVVYGGRNIKDAVCRLLKTTISNQVAEKYNWLGKKGKLPFGSLRLTAVITKCIQKNPAIKSATLNDVEVVVKEWLRGARDRDGGRKRRKSLNCEVETNQDRA